MKHLILFLFALLILAGCNDDKKGEEIDPVFPVKLSGCVQKGPFIIGTSIKMQELDDSFNPTGKSIETQIEKDNGSFAISGEIGSLYVEIIANGFYYNEVAGQLSTAPITLRAISEVSGQKNLNVNVLTSLQSQRIKTLLKEGMDFKKASQQSQQEVLKVFGIEQDKVASFDQMDISQKGDANAILLAISSIMQDNRTEAQLSELIAKVTSDMEADGTLDEENLKASLTKSAAGINNLKVQANLRKRYETLGMKDVSVPDFYGYLDSDGDGVLNNKSDYLVLEKRELYSEKEQSTDTLFLSANFVPSVTVPLGTDWIKVVECTKERLILSLTEGDRDRAATLSLASPDGKISKEVYVSKKGMLTAFNIDLSYGNSRSYLDDMVETIQVLGFDENGEKIFGQYDRNPVVTKNSYTCYVDLKGKEYAGVTLYAIVNSPCDFTAFSSTMQEMENKQSEIDLSTAENIENFLVGKINEVHLSSSGIGSLFVVPMRHPVAKLELRVDYANVEAEQRWGIVEAIMVKDIYFKSGSFFANKPSGSKNDFLLAPDKTGKSGMYVYGGSTLSSLVITTNIGYSVDVKFAPIDCRNGNLYILKLQVTTTGIDCSVIID